MTANPRSHQVRKADVRKKLPGSKLVTAAGEKLCCSFWYFEVSLGNVVSSEGFISLPNGIQLFG